MNSVTVQVEVTSSESVFFMSHVFQGCLASDHTVQLSQGESDIWGPIPLIYDDLLTFQLLVCIDPPYQLTPESKVKLCN